MYAGVTFHLLYTWSSLVKKLKRKFKLMKDTSNQVPPLEARLTNNYLPKKQVIYPGT